MSIATSAPPLGRTAPIYIYTRKSIYTSLSASTAVTLHAWNISKCIYLHTYTYIHSIATSVPPPPPGRTAPMYIYTYKFIYTCLSTSIAVPPHAWDISKYIYMHTHAYIHTYMTSLPLCRTGPFTAATNRISTPPAWMRRRRRTRPTVQGG